MGLGIGGEILCVLSGGLDISGHVETDPRYVAAERIARRWLTERGSASWAPTMGLGIGLLRNADLSRGALARLEGEARQEALRVQGVVSARVTASLKNGMLTLTAIVRLDVAGDFILTVDAAGAVEVLLQ
ncbi:MAG: hypothetical protein EKK62_03190 [Acidimicrobiia bacterium]|nr:MAG: hypothetical protein EKK62_03190 [Acidimicrobiia bacterium]